MKITKTLCAGALLITNLAHADLIAQYVHAVNKQDGLIVELSDLQRPEAQKEPSTCEKQGKRMVFISATDTKMFPRTIPYASGCWFYSSSSIIITANTLRETRPVNLSYPAKEFQTTSSFSTWENFSRNAPSIAKPVSKEAQEESEVIAGRYNAKVQGFFGGTHAMLTGVAADDCRENGGKRARVLGYLDATRKGTRVDGCWAYSNEEIRFWGTARIDDKADLPVGATWKANTFSKTEHFIRWE